MNITFNIVLPVLKYYRHINNILMEEIMSQISDLGLSFYLCQKCCLDAVSTPPNQNQMGLGGQVMNINAAKIS